MSNKFSWDSALGGEPKKKKKKERPGWLTKSPEEILMKSLSDMFEEKNKRPRRFDGFYHPSQIYDMCVVQEYFRRKLKIDLYDDAGMFNRLIMGAGTAAHKHFQEHIFGPAKLLIGDWWCQICGKMIAVKSKMPDECPDCNSRRPHIIYFELNALDEERNIRGKTDGILDVEGEECLLEMKTKNTIPFENIVKPYPKEIMQVNIYMHLLDVKKCIFTYIARESYDFRFIVVEKNPAVVQKAFDKVDIVENALKEGNPPTKEGEVMRKCRKRDSATAKKCPFYKECWS